MREAKSAKELPTKEYFEDVTAVAGGAAFGGLGGFYGCDLDDEGEYCYIQMFMPHDFNRLVSLALVFISNVTLADMTLTITVNYCHRGQAYTTHNKTLVKTVAQAVDNYLQELDITDLVDTGPLDKNDYLGISLSKAQGQTVDAIVLGARLKYTKRKK